VEDRFLERYRTRGKKLDMGKLYVRFRTLDDLLLDVVGGAFGRTPIAEFIARYQSLRARDSIQQAAVCPPAPPTDV
jgi:hypothetical protein